MNLKHLTDQVLLTEMLTLARKERALLSEVLWHLKEVDRRKLYCAQKCGSLFEYCVKVLKYSEGQASRRISACRLLKELPEISESVKKGEINLTQLNQAKNFFHEEGITDPDDKREVIEKIKGKTGRETEKILWELKEVETVRKVTISLNEETVEVLKRLRALKGHSCPDLDSLIMKMAETVGKVWDPTLVIRKRAVGKGETRFIQAGVRAEVWRRDKGKCTNCGSTFALELDHIRPFALGGKTSTENLRLLCRACNQRKGLEEFKKGGSFQRR